MNDKNPLLLPAGFYDLLPPDARKESSAVAQLLASFESYGYEQVNPPLMEFETTLLEGRGATLASQTFRVMDPMSRNMMGMRPDMTLQIARIARSRMASIPRPLRLCYAGPILHIKPEALQNERQLTQAGIELIGSGSLHADAEVMMVAARALEALGIKGVSIDINLPGLLARLCPEIQQDESLAAALGQAVMRRDSAGVERLPLKQAKTVASLLMASGDTEKTLKLMESLALPEVAELRTIISLLKSYCPQTHFTLDPLEFRGFDYHQGISFSLFAQGLRHELGRGGRYEVEQQAATGFTLYVTHLLDLLPNPAPAKRVLLPKGTSPEIGERLRSEGWITVYALSDQPSPEAKQLGLDAVWNGKEAARL